MRKIKVGTILSPKDLRQISPKLDLCNINPVEDSDDYQRLLEENEVERIKKHEDAR